ncbi:urease accessory protein UreF [Aquipuribacter nitratireducens]|uniref:Urease accessory protein UreF n=1 Tax=Aquipuribacter nitratireducens TaxID=650104 RepID=A0ABW0GRK4_9MICO
MTSALALLLGDGRLPTGGHVHSGGLEQARSDGRLTGLADLEGWLRRRLRTSAAVAAGVAAAACVAPHRYADLDAETDARTPSPAQREASRSQGRGLLRLAAATWPDTGPPGGWSALGRRPHHAVALGVAAAAAGLGPTDAAAAAVYLAVSGPAGAAQRLLALDPVAVAALTARLAAEMDGVVATAVAAAAGPLHDLPSPSDPLLDVLAERHAAAPDRLFAS